MKLLPFALWHCVAVQRAAVVPLSCSYSCTPHATCYVNQYNVRRGIYGWREIPLQEKIRGYGPCDIGLAGVRDTHELGDKRPNFATSNLNGNNNDCLHPPAVVLYKDEACLLIPRFFI